MYVKPKKLRQIRKSRFRDDEESEEESFQQAALVVSSDEEMTPSKE